MTKFVIVCHGGLADGLIQAMEMITGSQPEVIAIRLGEEDPIHELESRVEAAVRDRPAGQGVIILVDLFGASPFNVSARVAGRYDQVEVITGVNLAMLIETVLQRENASFQELVDIASAAGMSSVKVLSELLNQADDGTTK